MTKSEIMGVDERIHDVLKITNNYNYEDLIKAIFCINIDINNRSALSCQMALNLSLFEYQKVGDLRINTYEEFKLFFDKIKSVLDITPFDDYIIEDFGEVKFRYENKYYKVIVGTGHNQVYGELFCLDTLARKKKKEKELREIFKYTSEIIEFFEEVNLNDGKNGIRFQIPNKSLFEKTDIFFNTKLKEFNLHEIADIVEVENLPIEKIYFLKNGDDNVYPLWNTAILIDLFDKWYKDLNDEERLMMANETINKLISDLTILEHEDEPNVLFPISLFEDGKPNLKTKYSFFIKCDKGAIIAINREQFTNYGELKKALSSLKEMHVKNNLQLFELRKRRGKMNI